MIELSDWFILKDCESPYGITINRKILNSGLIFPEGAVACSISTSPTIFNMGSNGDCFFSYIYLQKKDDKIFRGYDISIFRSYKTLFEAVAYCDLYYKDMGILKLKEVNLCKDLEKQIYAFKEKDERRYEK